MHKISEQVVLYEKTSLLWFNLIFVYTIKIILFSQSYMYQMYKSIQWIRNKNPVLYTILNPFTNLYKIFLHTQAWETLFTQICREFNQISRNIQRNARHISKTKFTVFLEKTAQIKSQQQFLSIYTNVCRNIIWPPSPSSYLYKITWPPPPSSYLYSLPSKTESFWHFHYRAPTICRLLLQWSSRLPQLHDEVLDSTADDRRHTAATAHWYDIVPYTA